MQKNQEEVKESTKLANFYKNVNQPGEYYRCICTHPDCEPLLFSTFQELRVHLETVHIFSIIPYPPLEDFWSKNLFD